MNYPTNVNRTDELQDRFVDLKTERFKNKVALLGGSKSFPREKVARLKLPLSLIQVSFKILSYTCYLHEGIALLKRISRSAYIVTSYRELLATFKKKSIEVPLFSNSSLLYHQPSQVQLCAKLVDGRNISRIAQQFYNLRGLRTMSYI